MADLLDTIHDPFACEHMLIVQAKLIGQIGRRQVIVGFSKNVCKATGFLGCGALQGIASKKSPVHPPVATIAVLDPG